MKNQMKNKYCLDEKDWQKAKAALLLAKNFGLILDDTVEALEERRKEKNEENRHKQEKGELFYGPYFIPHRCIFNMSLQDFDWISYSHLKKLSS